MNFEYKFSFIFPVHNEEKIIKKQLIFFINYLKRLKIENYEIILMENGSSDNSLNLISNLAKKYSKLKIYHLSKASYGLAIKNASLVARGQYLVILDLDFYNLDILDNGLKLIENYQLIVASKSLDKTLDKRPFQDRLRTRVFNLIVKIAFKYPGSDTHGNKIIKNSLLLKKNIYCCFSKYEFFDTELLLRLTRTKQYKLKEIKTSIKEIRKSKYSILRRFKLCFFDLIRILSSLFLRNKKFEERCITDFNINADDYGITKYVDKFILAQKKANSITRISVLANLSNQKSLQNLKKLKNYEINLHFNLLRGKPISPIKNVSSLIDKNGQFFSLPNFLLRLFFSRINLLELEEELIQQLDYLKKNKISCIGIDSEQHLHAFYPIWPIINKFAQKHNLQVRSKESTLFHLKKHPVKYMFFYIHHLFFLKILKKEKGIEQINTYDALIAHPGTNYD